MDLSKVAFNTTDITTLGGLIITALAAIWGVRKAISLASRG